MKLTQAIPAKMLQLPELLQQVALWRLLGKTIVFTNGVFDILHEGHIASLSEAAALGDKLVVGVNADDSVKRLKGPTRPINNETARALLIASLMLVDAVVLFKEDTPIEVIAAIMPDVLVKGGDYKLEEIVGAKEVMATGGKVHIATIVEGVSTTAIIEKMKGSSVET